MNYAKMYILVVILDPGKQVIGSFLFFYTKYRCMQTVFLLKHIKCMKGWDRPGCIFKRMNMLYFVALYLRVWKVYVCSTRFPYHKYSCCLKVTRRMSLVEQELLTLLEHLSCPVFLLLLCCVCVGFLFVFLLLLLLLFLLLLFMLLNI